MSERKAVVIRTGVWAGMTEEEVAEFFNYGRDLDSPNCDDRTKHE